MTATATHDTKRGEDARARIAALSEIPGEWTSAVARWKVLNAPHLTLHGNYRAPSATFEYMLYQTLLGAWPLAGAGRCRLRRTHPGLCARRPRARARRRRAGSTRMKPMRTASTSFIGEDPRSRAIRRVPGLTANPGPARRAARHLELSEPAHPQGDAARRARLLPGHRVLGPVAGRSRQPPPRRLWRAARGAERRWTTPDWRGLTKSWPDGLIKLAWTRRLLKLRNELADVFAQGDYQPLAVRGAHADHVIAFARRHGRAAAIVVVGRQFAPFTKAGREWPALDGFDATVDITGYAATGLEGPRTAGHAGLP